MMIVPRVKSILALVAVLLLAGMTIGDDAPPSPAPSEAGTEVDVGANATEETDAPATGGDEAPVASPVADETTGAPSVTPKPSGTPSSRPSRIVDTEAPTQYEPDGDCWDNTTRVFYNLAGQPPFTNNEYILCPNTVYTIGVNFQGECCKDGDLPLYGRSGTHYKCGADGSSYNNCTIISGSQQFVVDEIAFQEESTNVVFEGFTFDSADQYVSLPSSEGDFELRDCIIQNQQAEGGIVMLHYSQPADRRRLSASARHLRGADMKKRLDFATSPEHMQDLLDIHNEHKERLLGGRELDEIDPNVEMTELVGKLTKSIIRDNLQGPIGDLSTFGIITIEEKNNIIQLEDCVFENNQFGDAAVQRQGYAVHSLGSPVIMNNVCFMDNNFVGSGTVQMFDDASYEFSSVYGTEDDGIACQFIAASPGFPNDPSNVTCVEYDATECTATLTTPPPTAAGETSEPTATPDETSEPTATPDETSGGAALLVSGFCLLMAHFSIVSFL